MPAFVYDAFSTTESFTLEAALGEGIAIYIYGANWNGSNWLSDPTDALSAVNDALNSIIDLDYSNIMIISSLSSLGTGMAFAVVDTVYKNSTYLSPDDVPTLRYNIQMALSVGETGLHLTYGDIVLGTSKTGI
jgi:hypothetical protein